MYSIIIISLKSLKNVEVKSNEFMFKIVLNNVLII